MRSLPLGKQVTTTSRQNPTKSILIWIMSRPASPFLWKGPRYTNSYDIYLTKSKTSIPRTSQSNCGIVHKWFASAAWKNINIDNEQRQPANPFSIELTLTCATRKSARKLTTAVFYAKRLKFCPSDHFWRLCKLYWEQIPCIPTTLQHQRIPNRRPVGSVLSRQNDLISLSCHQYT